MKDMTYNQVLGRTMDFYRQGLYKEAYDCIAAYADAFPEDRAMTYHMQLCMAGRMENDELALKALQAFYDEEFWCEPALLREDEDLKGLQGNPEYEALVENILRRTDEGKAAVRPEIRVIEPVSTQQGGVPLLMALHGNGQNARTSEEHWKNPVTKDWLLALPQSSQARLPGVHNWMDLERGRKEVRKHCSELAGKYRIAAENRIIAGFSGGGRLALRIILENEIPFTGFVLIGPWLPELEEWKPLFDGLAGRNIRGCVLIGDKDDICLQHSLKLVEILKDKGVAVELDLIPGIGHSYPDDFEARLERALAFICK